MYAIIIENKRLSAFFLSHFGSLRPGSLLAQAKVQSESREKSLQRWCETYNLSCGRNLPPSNKKHRTAALQGAVIDFVTPAAVGAISTFTSALFAWLTTNHHTTEITGECHA